MISMANSLEGNPDLTRVKDVLYTRGLELTSVDWEAVNQSLKNLIELALDPENIHTYFAVEILNEMAINYRLNQIEDERSAALTHMQLIRERLGKNINLLDMLKESMYQSMQWMYLNAHNPELVFFANQAPDQKPILTIVNDNSD